jgi:hypothetical protein
MTSEPAPTATPDPTPADQPYAPFAPSASHAPGLALEPYPYPYPYTYPYPAPGSGYYSPWLYAPAPQLSGWALTSMICGIISMVILQPITAILAIIFGYMALREVKRSGGQVDGHGMAVAGIVMGYIGIGLTVLVIALYIVYFVFIISTLGPYPD